MTHLLKRAVYLESFVASLTSRFCLFIRHDSNFSRMYSSSSFNRLFSSMTRSTISVLSSELTLANRRDRGFLPVVVSCADYEVTSGRRSVLSPPLVIVVLCRLGVSNFFSRFADSPQKLANTVVVFWEFFRKCACRNSGSRYIFQLSLYLLLLDSRVACRPAPRSERLLYSLDYARDVREALECERRLSRLRSVSSFDCSQSERLSFILSLLRVSNYE